MVDYISSHQEVDALKRNQKQSATTQGAVEVRLNRALEEADRYKAELQKARTSSRVNQRLTLSNSLSTLVYPQGETPGSNSRPFHTWIALPPIYPGGKPGV